MSVSLTTVPTATGQDLEYQGRNVGSIAYIPGRTVSRWAVAMSFGRDATPSVTYWASLEAAQYYALALTCDAVALGVLS